MTADDRTNEVFDRNLEQLMTVAPEPARLDDGARERMRAALRERVDDHGADEPAVIHTIPRRRPAAALVALAAAIVLAVVGVKLLTAGDGRGTPKDTDVASATGRGTGGGTTVDPNDVAGTNADPGDGLDPVATDGTGGGSRVEIGPDPGGTGSDETDPEGDTGSAIDPSEIEPGSIVARVTFGEGVAPPASNIVIWVKPMVDLPRVADPVAHEVVLAAADDEGGRTFVLAGALGPARAMGSSQVLVQIEAPGAAPTRALVAVADAERALVTFALTAGVAVSGFVVDDRTGTPIEGAVVAALDQLPMDGIPAAPSSADILPQPVTTTDANGAFTLAHVAIGGEVQLRASHPGFAPSIRVVDPLAAAPSPLRIALVEGGAVIGTCERSDGTRWAGATVVAASQSVDPTVTIRPAMTFGIATTDADGRYRIPDLPPGPYVVLLIGQPASRAEGPLGFTQTVIEGTEESVVDFLAAGSSGADSFTGRIRQADGQPISGMQLTLMRYDGGETARDNWRATETGPNGEFSFSDVDSGSYVLHTATESFKRMELVWRGDVSGPTDRTIVMPRTDWTITCRGAADDAVREGAWVILEAYEPTSQDWMFAGRATTSEDGTLTLPSLPPGRYRASVSGVAPGDGHGVTGEVELVDGASVTSEVIIAEGATLIVRVVERPGGAPVTGALVDIRDARGGYAPQSDFVRTDADGLAASLAVAYGTVDVLVLLPDGSRPAFELDFRAGGPGTSEPFEIALTGR